MGERIKVVPSSTAGLLFKPEYPQSMTPFKKLDVFSHVWMFMVLFVTKVHM